MPLHLLLARNCLTWLSSVNVRHINEDPGNPFKYQKLVGNVDVLVSEIPVESQVQRIAVNASYFLKVGGHFIVSFQAKRLKFGLPIASEAMIGAECLKLMKERLEPYDEVNIERDIAYYEPCIQLPL
ncbi:hypothetical protein AgCh_003131 [Apium graveolens]